MNTIDIRGAEGNPFVLLCLARKLCKKLGLNTKEVVSEMKSGDFHHLIATFRKHFSGHVILVSGTEDESDWGTDELGEI